MRLCKRLVLVAWFGLLVIPGLVQAIEFDPAKNNTGLTTTRALTFLSGGAERDPATVTFSLMNTALGFLGVASMMMIAYAGVLWFQAGDNEEHVSKAKQLITGALIGLVLALGSLALSVFIFKVILESTVAEQKLAD